MAGGRGHKKLEEQGEEAVSVPGRQGLVCGDPPRAGQGQEEQDQGEQAGPHGPPAASLVLGAGLLGHPSPQWGRGRGHPSQGHRGLGWRVTRAGSGHSHQASHHYISRSHHCLQAPLVSSLTPFVFGRFGLPQ